MSKIFLIGLMTALAFVSCAPQNSTEGAPHAISVPDLPALGPYAQAVEAGGTVYFSGIVAFDAKAKKFAEANIEAQTAQAFANLDTILAAADLSKSDIVKVTVYLKNPADFKPMNPLYARYFKDWHPARTTVPGVNWGRPDVLIELDVIAQRQGH